jgi:hypothetical protein
VKFRLEERSKGEWAFITAALLVKLVLVFAIFG